MSVIMLDKAAEKYIILLLGVKDSPMPPLWHLQKEMFMLSKAAPKVNVFFNFERHYNGPFSQTLQEITDEPPYYDDAWKILRNGTINLIKQAGLFLKRSLSSISTLKTLPAC